MKSRTLRARGTAHLRKRFRAECCVYEKTVELNATSCSNTPAGPTTHLSPAWESRKVVLNGYRRSPRLLVRINPPKAAPTASIAIKTLISSTLMLPPNPFGPFSPARPPPNKDHREALTRSLERPQAEAFR